MGSGYLALGAVLGGGGFAVISAPIVAVVLWGAAVVFFVFAAKPGLAQTRLHLPFHKKRPQKRVNEVQVLLAENDAPLSGSTDEAACRKKKPNGNGESDLLSLREDWQRFDLPLKSAAGKVRIDLPEAMTRGEWNYLHTAIEGYFGLVWGEEEETQ